MNSSDPQPCMDDVKCENCMTIDWKKPQDALNFEYLLMMLSTNFLVILKTFLVILKIISVSICPLAFLSWEK